MRFDRRLLIKFIIVTASAFAAAQLVLRLGFRMWAMGRGDSNLGSTIQTLGVFLMLAAASIVPLAQWSVLRRGVDGLGVCMWLEAQAKGWFYWAGAGLILVGALHLSQGAPGGWWPSLEQMEASPNELSQLLFFYVALASYYPVARLLERLTSRNFRPYVYLGALSVVLRPLLLRGFVPSSPQLISLDPWSIAVLVLITGGVGTLTGTLEAIGLAIAARSSSVPGPTLPPGSSS